MKKILLFVISLMLLASLSFWYSFKSAEFAFDASLFESTSSRYTMRAHENEDYDRFPVYIPPVSTKPGTFKYQLVLLNEKYQLLTNQQSNLFFATKRINEIRTWIDIVPVDLSVNSLKQIKHSSYPLGTFESMLYNYMALIDSEQIAVESINDFNTRRNALFELKRYVYQQRMMLDRQLGDQADTERNKHVKFLIELVFSHYFNRLSISSGSEMAGIARYSLAPIGQSYDYGTYDIYIDRQDMQPFGIGSASVGDRAYALEADREFAFVIRRVEVDPSDALLVLNIAEQEIALSQWSVASQIQSGSYAYVANITDALPFREVKLVISNALPAGTNLSLDMVSGSTNGKFNMFNFIVGEDESKNDGVTLEKQNKTDQLLLTVSSRVPLSQEVLSQTVVTMRLVELPEIVLEKMSVPTLPKILYNINAKYPRVSIENISHEQKNVFLQSISSSFLLRSEKIDAPGGYTFILEPKPIALIKKVIAVLIIFIAAIIIFSYKKVVVGGWFGTITFLKSLVSTLLRNKYLCYLFILLKGKYRWVLCVIGMILVADISLMKYSLDPLTIGIALVIFTLSFKSGMQKVFYVSAVLAMIAAIALQFLGWHSGMQKAADWTFVFLCFAVLRDLIYLKLKK